MGPTFTITAAIWRLLKRATRDVRESKNEQEKRIDLPGGGSVTVKSADNPDSLRGEGLDGMVLDEAAFLDQVAWTESLRPALTDKQGWAMFISTPNGPNWFKELFEHAGREDNWHGWQRPSSDNPLVPAIELEAARRDMGVRAFMQEHGAQFVAREGAEFDGGYFTSDIWFDDWPEPKDVRLKIMALDPSKRKHERADPSAFIMMQTTEDGTLWVDANIQWRDIQQIVNDGLALGREFRPDAFGVETVAFQEMLADTLEAESAKCGFRLPIFGVNPRLNKTQRIRATLTPYLARRAFRFRRTAGGKALVEQLQGFGIRGIHDDGPDALEQAIQVARHVSESRAGQQENDGVDCETIGY